MKKIKFKNKNNLTLIGNLYPCNSDTIAILCHGFTSDKNRNQTLARALNQAKIDAFAFDFSGCGESDDQFITVENRIDDLKSAIKYIENLQYKKIVLYGHSHGSLICLHCYQKKINHIVLTGALIAPIYYDWSKHLTKAQIKTLKEKNELLYKTKSKWRKTVKINSQTLLDFEQINSKKILTKIKCPILIIHGNNDEEEKQLLKNTQTVKKYLPKNSKIIIIKEANHSFDHHYDEVIKNITNAIKNKKLQICNFF